MSPINIWWAVLNNKHSPIIKDIAIFLEYTEGSYFCIRRDIKQSWSLTHWISLPERGKM